MTAKRRHGFSFPRSQRSESCSFAISFLIRLRASRYDVTRGGGALASAFRYSVLRRSQERPAAASVTSRWPGTSFRRACRDCSQHALPLNGRALARRTLSPRRADGGEPTARPGVSSLPHGCEPHGGRRVQRQPSRHPSPRSAPQIGRHRLAPLRRARTRGLSGRFGGRGISFVVIPGRTCGRRDDAARRTCQRRRDTSTASGEHRRFDTQHGQNLVLSYARCLLINGIGFRAGTIKPCRGGYFSRLWIIGVAVQTTLRTPNSPEANSSFGYSLSDKLGARSKPLPSSRPWQINNARKPVYLDKTNGR